MKKRILSAIFASFMVLLLAACGNSQTVNDPEAPNYADQEFIQDLSAALEKRFDAADKLEALTSELTDTEYAKQLTAVIDIEVEALSEYKDRTFEDIKLQEKVLAYLNALNDSKAPLADMGTDAYGAIEKYNEAYNERIKLLSSFVSDYSLTVDAVHQPALDDILTNAQGVIKNDEKNQAIEAMLKNLNFEKIEDGSSYPTYRALLENTTEYTISSVSYSIDLLDSNGVVVEQAYAGVSDLAPGKKVNVEFLSDKAFSSYEINIDYYE